jgi:protein O-GlcNAc transferase
MRLAVAALVLMLCACALPRGLRGPDLMRSTRQAPEPTVMAEKPLSAGELLVDGDRMRDSGNVSRAAWSYLRALRADPSRVSPRERIGYLHLAAGAAPAAQTAFEFVLSSAPDSAPANLGLGLAHLEQGHRAEARTALERALVLDPSSAAAAVGMGLLSDWSGEHELARSYYERARQLEPLNQEIENNLGVSYLMSGDYAQAEAHLRRAIQLDPSDTVQFNNLGLALGELERFDEALDTFRRASNEATAQNNTGYLCYLKGNYARAIQHYERALAAAPSDRLPIIRNLRLAQEALDRSHDAADTMSAVPVSPPAP